ncbi:MAG: hypothetical protein B6244_05345 [Candidatus Cloacimonetes bacterium 4572_55]|nr:MAG: hypothetical protein B6244_05345 [Candidatus Cloacimonetes bacterium 4572_55]
MLSDIESDIKKYGGASEEFYLRELLMRPRDIPILDKNIEDWIRIVGDGLRRSKKLQLDKQLMNAGEVDEDLLREIQRIAEERIGAR